jgi:anti-sigma regulatory factor (Ser/Thr protein kinase)
MRTSRIASARDREIAGCVRLRPGARRVGFSFPADAVQVMWARHRVAALLATAWGEGRETDEATLAASELFANGCVHGVGRVQVRVRISTSSMTLRVSTQGAWRSEAVSAPASAEAENGRGLEIVRALAESLVIAPDPSGYGNCVTIVCRAGRIGDASLPQGSR